MLQACPPAYLPSTNTPLSPCCPASATCCGAVPSAHLACRLLSTVGKLDYPAIWYPRPEAEEEAFAAKTVREAAEQPRLLAFLTLLLVSEDVEALFLFPDDGPIAVQAARQLWAAVDCAFSTVSCRDADRDLSVTAASMAQPAHARTHADTHEALSLYPAITHGVYTLCFPSNCLKVFSFPRSSMQHTH